MARAGIVVVGFAPVDGVGRGERHLAGRGIDRSAGQPEILLVPWRLGLAARLDPVFGVLHQLSGRHDRIDELHRFGLRQPKLVALEQELERVARRHHAGNPLGSAGAGKKSDLDLGQPDTGLFALGCHPVVAGEAKLEAAAECGAGYRRHPGLAAGLKAPVEQRQPAALLEQQRGARLFPLRFRDLGELATEYLQHGEVSAGAERVLTRGDDRALDRGFVCHLFNDARKLLDHFEVDDIHRAPRGIPSDERDAVAINIELEIGHCGYGSLW